MLSLIIVVLATVAAGFIVWANDKRHAKYGAGLPAGVSVGRGCPELDHPDGGRIRLPSRTDVDSLGAAHCAGRGGIRRDGAVSWAAPAQGTIPTG